MASSPASPTLPCKQCGYSNEPERVYCHNCGAKLDRSLLPKEDQLRRESPDKARRRIRRMANPEASPILREAKALAKTLAWAAVVAALILAALPPADAPAKQAELGDRMVGSDLITALEKPQPTVVAFSEADINSFFKTSVKAAPGPDWLPLKFDRAYVKLLPGAVRIGQRQTIYDYPLYSSTAWKLEVKDGAFTATNVGGTFGRLAVHPVLMGALDFVYQKFWTALKRERDMMSKMQMVRVEQGKITLITKGAGR